MAELHSKEVTEKAVRGKKARNCGSIDAVHGAQEVVPEITN